MNVIYEDPEKFDFNGMKVVDMHCHTTCSDVLNHVDDMIKRAKKLKIGISITDHNAIDASVKACKNLFAIPGMEITSNSAIDYLFYFYNVNDLKEFYIKRIKGRYLKSIAFNLRRLSWSSEELLDFAREYGCFVSLPHPLTYRPKNSFEYMNRYPYLLKKIDAIEVLNCIMKKESNDKAIEWCKSLKKAYTGASDAHMTRHLGRVLTATHADTVEEFLDNII